MVAKRAIWSRCWSYTPALSHTYTQVGHIHSVLVKQLQTLGVGHAYIQCWPYTLGIGRIYTRCWSYQLSAVLVIYTWWHKRDSSLTRSSEEISCIGAPSCKHFPAHSCTIFPCYLGMEIKHRVVTSYMGVLITNGALGPKLTKLSAVFGKSHLPMQIPCWKTKKYHKKNFLGRKKARVQGFHEFPKMKM